MFNKHFLIFSVIGLLFGGLLVWILKDLPLFILLVSIIFLVMSFYYTQMKKRQMEAGVILTWFSAIMMALVTMWVYQYFEWPPTILKVLLLNIQVIMIAEVVFVLLYYFTNKNEIYNYLHKEVFVIKIIQLLISIMAPLAAYNHISYDFMNIVITLSLAAIWVRISYEIAGMRYD